MYCLPVNKGDIGKKCACLANKELIFENHDLFYFSTITRPRLHFEAMCGLLIV